jgi:hypothetical protein
VERAHQEEATIEWGDESGLRFNEYGGRGYAPIGKTQEIRPSERKREHLNFIASVSNTGQVQFMLYTCNLSVEIFIKFLERLIDQHAKKLFWISDRHPIHLNPRVQQWLKEHSQRIEMENFSDRSLTTWSHHGTGNVPDESRGSTGIGTDEGGCDP